MNTPVNRSVGVPREVKTAEHRVAITPDGVRELERHGIDVYVETEAGAGASITDDDFAAAGATIVPTAADAWARPMVVKVKEPIHANKKQKEEINLMTEKARKEKEGDPVTFLG